MFDNVLAEFWNSSRDRYQKPLKMPESKIPIRILPFPTLVKHLHCSWGNEAPDFGAYGCGTKHPHFACLWVGSAPYQWE